MADAANWLGNDDILAPALNYAAVTPSDSTVFPFGLCRALYVGVAGNVTVLSAGGAAVTFSGVPAGVILPIRCKRVNSTSTTATNIVALY